MPRIDNSILDCVVYLYGTESDARSGVRWGGSGFLFGVESDPPTDGYWHIYVVTNSHVAREAPIIRLNTVDGDSDLIIRQKNDWSHHPDGDDIAVCLITDDLPSGKYRFRFVADGYRMMQPLLNALNIGPGDEVFTAGRLVDDDDKQTNAPIVRFGHIAMKPSMVIHPSGLRLESFLVEMVSLSGFSGSPVFVYLTRTVDFLSEERKRLPEQLTGPWLLGIDWGHFPVWREVMDADRNRLPERDRIQVELNSGLMAVAPAWKLWELLESEALMTERKAKDKERRDKPHIVLDSEQQDFTRKDMQDALRKVSRRRPKPSEPDSSSSGT